MPFLVLFASKMTIFEIATGGMAYIGADPGKVGTDCDSGRGGNR
jgi:hypothetical protein